MDYRVYMEELDNLEGGWCCGHSERSNAPFYRTTNKKDADRYDDYNAVLVSSQYRKLGFPCKVIPRVTMKRQLEILGGYGHNESPGPRRI